MEPSEHGWMIESQRKHVFYTSALGHTALCLAALTAAQLVVRVARVQMRQDPLHSRVIQLQGCPGFCFGLDLAACNVGLRGCLGLSLGTAPPHHRGLRDRRSWTLHGRAAPLRQRTGFMLKLRRRWV